MLVDSHDRLELQKLQRHKKSWSQPKKREVVGEDMEKRLSEGYEVNKYVCSSLVKGIAMQVGGPKLRKWIPYLDKGTI